VIDATVVVPISLDRAFGEMCIDMNQWLVVVVEPRAGSAEIGTVSGFHSQRVFVKLLKVGKIGWTTANVDVKQPVDLHIPV
jgi:hypothetical protein